MGSGYWNTTAATNYVSTSYTTAANCITDFADLNTLSAQEIYTARKLDPTLDPKGIIRECCDSEDHPNSLPIILALDVTGSMGEAAKMCMMKLDETMTELYKVNQDVEFCIMGVGDFVCDISPLQVSQFEADIRILDASSRIWLEFHGGGNKWESYTAPWYFGLNRCKLDCWNRGKKGIIITMGDEYLNPSLPADKLCQHLGVQLDEDVDTKALYAEASKKFDIYHLAITNHSSYNWHAKGIEETWRPLLGDHLIITESDKLPQIIAAIVNNANLDMDNIIINTNEGISW